MIGTEPKAALSPSGQQRRWPSRGTRRRGVTHAGTLPYLLVAPLLLFIVVLAIAPALWTGVQAFFHVALLDPPTRFVGLGNFRQLIATAAIRQSLGNTVLYVLFGVILSSVLGMLFAVILQRPFPGRTIVMALVILPWALPGVVEGVIWNWIYDPTFGVLNSVLHSLHLIGGYHVWLGQNRYLTIFGISLVQVWQIVPLSTLLILASLQLIPEELYGAARVDGANRWQMFRRITLPLARPGLAVAMVQAVIATLNIFDQAYILNGAASTGSSLMMETYFLSFQNLNFGEGYALSLFVTVATVVVSFGVLRLVYRKVEY